MRSNSTRELLAPRIGPRLLLKVAFGATLVAAFFVSWNRLNMSIFGFFDDLGNVANLFRRMYPPDFSDFGRIVRAMLETIWMALLGTVGSVLLSYPLALGAALNTSPHPLVRSVCRTIITLARAVPELILAAIFVAAFGPGPFPGILGLALHSIGMIGKLFADAFEETNVAPRDAVASVGSTHRQTVRAALLPQALPSMIATSLFRFEINLRGSAVLGIVGAGGIGTIISESLENIQYKPALASVAVLFAVILAVELLSSAIRQSLIGNSANVRLTSQRPQGLFTRFVRRHDLKVQTIATTDKSVNPPWTSERLFRTSVGGLFVVLVVVSVFSVDINWLSTIGNLDRLKIVLRQMFPPSFGGESKLLMAGLLESLEISIVATLLGVIVALPIGAAMARNVNLRRWSATAIRVFVLLLRGIPELIIAVIFVSAMGLGPVPGTLALTVTVIVFAAKLFADSIEEVDAAPREALISVGATRRQEFVAAVVPQFLSPFIANLFYLFDVYFRSSTVLGIVGGGGIGYLLIQSIRVFQFKVTTTIVIGVFLVVLAIEWLGIAVKRLYR